MCNCITDRFIYYRLDSFCVCFFKYCVCLVMTYVSGQILSVCTKIFGNVMKLGLLLELTFYVKSCTSNVEIKCSNLISRYK